MVKQSIVLGLLCFFSPMIHAAVSAQVDKSTLSAGDSVQLTLSAGHLAPSAVPDLSSVIDDFNLLSSSQTQEVMMDNDHMITRTIWIFTLAPKHAGHLTIPAISVGKDHTQPISLNVQGDEDETGDGNTPAVTPQAINPKHTNATHLPDIFLKASLVPEAPYVQSQAVYQLKLYYDKQIANPELTDPGVDNGSFVRMGQNTVYQSVIDHQPYQVIEMTYAFFPEKSGNMVIEGPVFSGKMLNNNNNNAIGFNMNNFIPVKATANTIHVMVKSIPAVNQGWWLPAAAVSLKEKWSAPPAEMTVGMPITRTVRLIAKEAMGTQLPPLNPEKLADFDLYPEKPSIVSRTDGRHLFGERTEKVVYIPTHAGNITLPAIKVAWFNTHTQQAETIDIPSKTVHVMNASGTSTSQPSPSPKILPKTGIHPNPSANVQAETMKLFTFSLHRGVYAMLLLVTGLLLGILLVLRKQHSKTGALGLQAEKQLKQAIKSNNKDILIPALLTWANLVFPARHILCLADLNPYCASQAAKDSLLLLEQAQYANLPDKNCDPKLVKAIMIDYMKQAKTVDKAKTLPPLYPE